MFNHTLAAIKTIRPSIFFANPKFYIRPKGRTSSVVRERIAAIGEGVLDAIARQDQNLKIAGQLATWQAFTRIAVLKVIHDPKMEKNPRAGEPMFRTDAEGMPILDDLGRKIPLIHPRTRKKLLEPKMIMADQIFRFEWVDARNMLLPDEGPDQSKWTWIGEQIIVTLDEAKEDERFKSHLRSQLVSNISDPTRERNQTNTSHTKNRSFDNEDDALAFFKYTEIYDIKNKMLRIHADGQEFQDFLMEDDLPEGIEDHPYSILPGFIPIMGPDPSPWPLPFTHPWLDPQKEYNIRRRQITEGAKRSARKGVYENNAFQDEDEAVKLMQSPDDMVFARVNNVEKVKILETPDLNPSIYNDIPLLQNDWITITGQTGPKLASPDAGSATEASFVERAANLRESDMLDAVTDWLGRAGKKMLQLVKRNLTLEMWISLRGFNDDEFKRFVQAQYGIPPEIIEFTPGLKEIFKERFGKEEPLRVTREKLIFEADVDVVPGSFKPQNLDVERSQWLQFLKIVGQFPQMALSRELLRETASKFQFISERALDELTALAQKMIEVNANQAGRSQGGAGAGGGTVNPAQQAMAGIANSLANRGAGNP